MIRRVRSEGGAVGSCRCRAFEQAQRDGEALGQDTFREHLRNKEGARCSLGMAVCCSPSERGCSGAALGWLRRSSRRACPRPAGTSPVTDRRYEHDAAGATQQQVCSGHVVSLCLLIGRVPPHPAQGRACRTGKGVASSPDLPVATQQQQHQQQVRCSDAPDDISTRCAPLRRTAPSALPNTAAADLRCSA